MCLPRSAGVQRRLGVLPKWVSPGWRVAVESQGLVAALLGQGHLGEHAPGPGPACGGGVEQHGFLDAGEFAEQDPD